MLKPVLFVAAAAVVAAVLVPDFAGRLLGPSSSATTAAPATTNLATDAIDTGTVARIAADTRGHYAAEIQINGRPLSAIVDTGASQVTLRYEDARALGLVLPGDKFDVVVRTANRDGRARRITLRSLRLGPITMRDVEALVVEQGALGTNLLGMSFLRRLSRYEARNGTLVLEH